MKKYFSFIPFSKNQYGVILAGTIIVVLFELYVYKFEDADAYSVAHSQIIEYIDQSLLLKHWDIVDLNMHDESIELPAHTSASTPYPSKQKVNDIARVNTVSMLRLWKDRSKSLKGIHGRLVRKNSAIKEFEPDTWESEILSNSAINESDIISEQNIGEYALLRLFRPQRVTTRCVSCHADWSDKENEIICGISVAVPMNELTAMKNKRVAKVGIMLIGVWILGVATFSIFALRYNKRRNDNEIAESFRRRMESQLISVWDSSRDGMRITDEHGIAVEVNSAYCMMVGKPKNEIIGKPFTSVYAPSYHEESLQKHNQRFEMRSIDSIIQREVTLWNGNRLWVEVSSSFMNLSDGSTNLLSVFRDVTERKKIEAVSNENEKKYKGLFDDAPVGYHEIDVEGCITRVNRTEFDMLGYTEKEMIAHHVWTFHADEEQSRQLVITKLSGTIAPSTAYECNYRRKGGGIIPVIVEDRILRTPEGSITGIRTTIQDITIMKELQQAMRETTTSLETIIGTIGEGISLNDKNGHFEIYNSALESILGYTKDEANTLHDFLSLIYPHAEQRQVVLDGLKVLFVGRKTLNVESTILSKDGTIKTVLTSSAMVIQHHEPMFLTAWRDITQRKKSEQLLFEQKVTLQAITQSAQEAIVMMDDEGIISFWNAAAVRIFGWSENEAIGTNLHSLIAPQRFHAAHNNAFPAFRVSGIGAAIGKTVELQGQRKDRSEVDIALSLSAVQLNKKWNAVGILRDITEQKRMELVRQVQYDIAHAATTIEKSENFFASIRTNLSKLINTNNFYIALYDDDTGMVSFPYFMDEEDETPEPRTMGRGLTDYVIRTGTSVFGTLEKCNELEQQGHIDIIGHPSAIWLGAPLKIGNRIFGVISVQSYTDPQCYSPADLKILEFVSNQISSAINRKQAEEQIRSQLSIIEETNKELGSARDIAIDANKAKSSFLANMSHELRTPLNAIIGYSEILIDEMGDADEKRYTSDIEKILTSGKNLLSLINDILDHSKIEAGRMELFIEEFNLQTLLNEIEDTIRPMVKSKSNTLTVAAPEESIVLRLDHTKVRQILFNLLSNSSKFSEKGNITLSVKKDQSKEKFPYDVVTFSVADNGIGMTDTQMKGLFKEFSQADNSIAKNYGGTGLGLTISKRFCEMMNGSIHVQSIPSKGTTFTVTLPITFEETVTSAPATALTDSTANDRAVFTSSTVLIIDDDPNVRDLLSRTLIKEGYAVQSADSGDDGIALARKINPIVIILDVMMPKKDGWAVLREIKDDPELKSIPVVMHTIIDNRNLGFAVGAQDFLIKPVNPDVVVKLLDRYMQNSSAMNILIVDDEQKQRDMISRILSKGKWNVRTADNGKSAIALLSQLIPDLIILDLMMPTMDGYEFLQIIKEREEWSHIPVLILTSMDLSKNDYERLSGSVADVLQKGVFDPRQLIKIVHRFSQLPLTQQSVPLE